MQTRSKRAGELPAEAQQMLKKAAETPLGPRCDSKRRIMAIDHAVAEIKRRWPECYPTNRSKEPQI